MSMIKTREKLLAEIMGQFLRVVNKFNRFEKIPMDFGIDEKLFPSEIHTIEAIGRHPQVNVTQLAQKLGITKGALSQTLKKLVEKQLAKKVKSIANDKELFLELTQKGRKAYSGHAQFHEDMYKDFMKYMDKISHRDFKTFQEILGKIEHHVELYASRLS